MTFAFECFFFKLNIDWTHKKKFHISKQPCVILYKQHRIRRFFQRSPSIFLRFLTDYPKFVRRSVERSFFGKFRILTNVCEDYHQSAYCVIENFISTSVIILKVHQDHEMYMIMQLISFFQVSVSIVNKRVMITNHNSWLLFRFL